MKALTLLFSFLMVGIAPVEAKTVCTLPIYIQAEQGPPHSLDATDGAVDMFLYGLKSAVRLRKGCIVDKMPDAHLGLYITTLKLINDSGRSDASVVAVALAVPLNGIPVYMDDYVLVIRDTDGVDGQVNALLQSIGRTLDKHSHAH